MNKHDEERKRRVIKALLKVIPELTNARLYLTVREDELSKKQLYTLHDVNEHVMNALELLGAAEGAEG